MPNHAHHTVVDQFLGRLDREARICLIILYVQDKFNRLAIDGWILRILFVERKLRTLLQVLAHARDRPR